MPKITKAMLEEENIYLRLENEKLIQRGSLHLDRIEILEKLVKLSPTGGLFMAMMSTNKLARKMVERVYPKGKKE